MADIVLAEEVRVTWVGPGIDGFTYTRRRELQEIDLSLEHDLASTDRTELDVERATSWEALKRRLLATDPPFR